MIGFDPDVASGAVEAAPPPRPRRPRAPLSPRRSSRRGWLLPAAIVLLGLVVRAYEMQVHPFEEDELYTVIEAGLLLDSPLTPGIHARPLYFVVQHLLLPITPITHAGLRALPVLFGVLGIAVTWLLGYRLFGAIGGAVSAFLVAVSPWHLHASGMARYWSLIYL